MVNTAPSYGLTITPIKSINLLSPQGNTLLPHTEITVGLIGQKAYGLSCIPQEWVPPFCVISHSLAQLVAENKESIDLTSLLQGIPWVRSSAPTSGFILRSSAVDETMDERGSLISEDVESLKDLRNTVSVCVAATKTHNKTIHWILQKRIETRLCGHLSNERRVAYAKRDWVIEFEALNSADHREPLRLAIRRWRDGILKPAQPLECPTAISIDRVLRQPAQWAAEYKIRMHFEWVWDGSHVWLVQGDVCTTKHGTDPRTLLPKYVQLVQAESLHCFRNATPSDFEKFRKLSNTKLYSKLGYQPPHFYVLDDRSAIEQLLSGIPSQHLIRDLQILVAQPLVIRTDGNLPAEKRQMLPRSDELRSVDAVISWFRNELPKELDELQEYRNQLVFICHHFVPALASAWSMAEPGRRVVRVEALWGIPEGMYWYGHDAYEIDTGDVDASRIKAEKFKYSRRERYKEWYIAPNEDGVWCAHRTTEEFDWKATISNDQWLAEMALVTREISEELGYAVNVMWFLGVHPQASKHNILPWYHEKSELDRSALRVAPRFKRAGSTGVELHTQSDWDRLKQLDATELDRVKRIAVSPRDPGLIRNKEFLGELAIFAKEHKAVIELRGGVLSHVFYILQRAGCIVEIVDLFGAREENLVFKKVVRDKIPESIVERGELVTQVKIHGEELVAALKSKLIEEAIEVMDAKSTDEIMEELADVLEVVHALAHHLKVSLKNIEEARKSKRQKRGGFDQGKVLVKTIAPTSLSIASGQEIQTADLFDDGGDVYFDAGMVSLEPEINLHQDEREVAGGKERLLEIELPVVLAESVNRSTEFRLALKTEQELIDVPVIGEWSISRKQSELKIRLVIRPLPTQTQQSLDFE